MTLRNLWTTCRGHWRAFAWVGFYAIPVWLLYIALDALKRHHWCNGRYTVGRQRCAECDRE